MSNMKGFARAQRQYEARECPSCYEICGCECGDADCKDCTDEETGFIDILYFVHRKTSHVANKDHYSRGGKLLVRKGFKYSYSYHHQVTRDRNDGEVKAEVTITKVEYKNQ